MQNNLNGSDLNFGHFFFSPWSRILIFDVCFFFWPSILSAHLEASFEEVENHLLNLEDLCGQCELERYKHMQSQHLENYKKNKRWVWKIDHDIHFQSQSFPQYFTCYSL